MIRKIPKLEFGKKGYTYMTSDNELFRYEEEAEWHELVVCQLKQRKLTVDIPEHVILTFINEETLQSYLKECYGHLSYVITTPLEQLTFPNSYVVIERVLNEESEKQSVYHIELLSEAEFKRQVAVTLLS